MAVVPLLPVAVRVITVQVFFQAVGNGKPFGGRLIWMAIMRPPEPSARAKGANTRLALNSSVSGKSKPVSMVNTGKRKPCCLARCIISSTRSGVATFEGGAITDQLLPESQSSLKDTHPGFF